MATGSNRRMIWNTREQILTTDLNRAEAFVHADLAEIYRSLFANLNQPSAWLDEGREVQGREDHNTTEIPLNGVVLSGLLARPTNASMNVVIDSGVAMVVDPDSNPSLDDSPYKLVRDPGAQVTVLQNTSGSTRVDVIECSRADVITETDSRNQYNTSTGLFAPVSFNKVGAGQFSYRVRQGTPGAGVPAAVQGWLPLAVVVIPTATTTSLDACAFYDVRPLVGSRVHSTNRHTYGYGHFRWCKGSAYPKVGGNLIFQAQAEVHDDWGYRLGGTLQSVGNTTSMAEGYAVDLGNPQSQESGFSTPIMGYYYIYLAVPVTTDSLGNLVPLLGPRWCRYMRPLTEFLLTSQVAQLPVEPDGIVVVSTKAPNESGTALLSSPTSLGLNCQMKGYLVAMGYSDSSATMRPFIADGRRINFITTYAGTSEPKLTAPTLTTANTAQFTLAPDRDFPRSARRIYGYANISFNLNGVFGLISMSEQIALQSNSSQYEVLGHHTVYTANLIASNWPFFFPVSIPIENNRIGFDSNRIYTIVGDGAGCAVFNGVGNYVSVFVTGFEF